MKKKGELVCVGVGMTLGAHISPVSRSCIEQADICFVAVSDGIVEQWIESLNNNCHSLQKYYEPGKSRNETYRDMVNVILDSVREGKNVCGVFYGHPGVFALAPHKAIEIAKNEGYLAHMEPGISAEDCLYADLGIDPGTFGCMHMEASQFMFYKRVVDVSGYLILWQIGVSGDLSYASFETNEARLKILVEMLNKYYPVEHQIYLYEAKTLPTSEVRIDPIKLNELPFAHLNTATTLVLPPCEKMEKNLDLINKLKKLQ